MTPLLYLALLGCAPRDTGHTPDKDSPHDTGRVDSPADSAESGDSSETAETAETADTGETADTDTGVDTAPPPCDRSLGWSFVACGTYQTCGIHADGCAECWGRGKEDDDTSGYDTGGRYHWHGEDEPPEGSYTFLAMNAAPLTDETPNACGILDDGSALCWGREKYGVNDVPPGSYTSVAVWDAGGFGLGTDGVVQQWGYGDPPPGTFTDMAIGGSAVFLQNDGQLYGTSITGFDVEAVPAGTYSDVGLGESYACAVSTDGTILCWHLDDPENAPYEHLTINAPVGVWSDVCNLGGSLACALDVAGTAACWDSDDDRWDPPSDVLFTQIACGWAHVCGVTVDSRIECWGWNDFGEGTPPN